MTVAYGHRVENTPLQAGVVMAAMVNGGYSVQPTIYKIDPEDAVRIPVISEASSAFMRDLTGMRGALVTLLKHRPGNRRTSAVRGN